MTRFLLSFILANFLVTPTEAGEDYSCTIPTENGHVYTWRAVACTNTLADSICEYNYGALPGSDYPREDSNTSRPHKCHTFDPSDGEPVYGDAKTIATLFCPKTCGYCCETPDFICENRNATLNCDTVTKDDCMSSKLRQKLSRECPSICGFCDLHGCLDLVEGCGKDPKICGNPKMLDFVEKNCKRTCGMCPMKVTNSIKQELK